MNTAPASTNLNERLLQRTGKFYIASILLISQIITIPVGIALAAILVGVTSELTTTQITRLAIVTALLMVVRNAFLLLYGHLSNQEASTRIEKWVKNEPLEKGGREEILAWRQITSIPWRYVRLALPTLLLFVLPLAAAYLAFGLKGNPDQVSFLFFAGIASGLINELFEMLLLERAFTNARKILTPEGYDSQRSGTRGLRLGTKFLMAFFVLILVTILAIAPIGFHQTSVALANGTSPVNVLANLQIQTIIIGILFLLFGFGLSFLLTNSVSQPLRRMIDTFRLMESGDLKQRVPILATDEVGELAIHFNQMVANLEELQNSLEERVAKRTEQLNATLEVGRAAANILIPEELITKVVNLINERFQYPAAIFLVDPTNQYAELKDAAGGTAPGQKIQGHRVELGDKSCVSSAIISGQARIAENSEEKTNLVDPGIIPELQSEMAVPLIANGRIIGAMDVQSSQEAAFGKEEINTLQGISNQVAIALENARLFQETQKSLDEARAIQRTYITEAWSETTRELDGYEYVNNNEQTETNGETTTVNVPLTLRDQIIGHLQLEGEQEWVQDERNLIEAVATQATLALENARLLNESQQIAIQERLVAEITGKIWTSASIDGILQTTIKELSRAFSAAEGSISLEVKE